MYDSLRNLLQKFTPKRVQDSLIYTFTDGARQSYSQEGEDLILERIFEEKNGGFYVDVGAHHPTRFSNTYLFYKKGWRGINIDAMPGSMTLFDKLRPRDINIEAAISDSVQELMYSSYNESAINTFNQELVRERTSMYKVINKIKIKTQTLADIIEKNLPNEVKIDFLSIDVEGMDYNVLRSNNWNSFQPEFILLEFLNKSVHEIYESRETLLLAEKNYSFFCKTNNTVFYKRT